MEALPLSVGGGVGGEPSRDEGTPHEGGGVPWSGSCRVVTAAW